MNCLTYNFFIFKKKAPDFEEGAIRWVKELVKPNDTNTD
jgi:hypothetical protein